MTQEEQEVRRFLDVLGTLMRMLDVSYREIERRLELKHGTVSRLLNGKIEAKLEVVLGVARALGLEYEELFAFAYPDRPVPRPESASAHRIRTMLENLRPQDAGTAEKATKTDDRDAIYQEIKKAVREVLAET
jgi:transcriptional regulator with XRE-family HTH domain